MDPHRIAREIGITALECVNGLLLALAWFSHQNSIPYVLGGTIALLIIPPFLILFSIWFKRCRVELNFLSLMIIGTLAWQYINYYDLEGKPFFSLLTLFLLVESLILFLLGYILLRPFHFKDSISKDDFRKLFEKSILAKYTILVVSPSIAFSYIFARLMLLANDSSLVRNHTISFVQIGVLIAAICNLICYFVFARQRKQYFESAYQKRGINMSVISKFALYLLMTTFILGGIVEVSTRKNMPLYFGTYLFVVTAVLLLWRIYRAELLNATVDVKQLIVEEMPLDYRFILKYIIITTVIGSISILSFIFLLMKYRQ